MRSALLAAAHSPRLQNFSEHSRLAKPVVRRFVAGSDESAALATTAILRESGRLVSLDFLGEDITSRAGATETVQAYQSLLKSLAELGLADGADVSVKLSALGQRLPDDGIAIAAENAAKICAAAAMVGASVTLDMEDHTTTDATLAAAAELRPNFPSLGSVVQAYLKRTEADCRDLAATETRVRLCKGAYAEPESVAFRGSAVDESYLRCLKILVGGAGYPMFASHDPAMIAAAQRELRQRQRARNSYEFQMLLGIRTDEQLALAAAGQRVRIYVPYGNQWYAYFMRRLAERPANLRFFLRALAH